MGRLTQLHSVMPGRDVVALGRRMARRVNDCRFKKFPPFSLMCHGISGTIREDGLFDVKATIEFRKTGWNQTCIVLCGNPLKDTGKRFSYSPDAISFEPLKSFTFYRKVK